ncbi:MAG: dihydroorotate dehydrogenase [Dethiobacter sp.]|jgi:dihydroorotate dehydrogenase (NAD+) catalytic subunit|nr:dihydroorotate dehydrogenase [Dethiobacter sp.]
MKPDLSVKIGGMTLLNPVMPASGCFGYGEEYAHYFDLAVLGAIIVKGTTASPCPGNPPPRLAETAAGLLNAIGLQNPGAASAREKISSLAKYGVPVIVNVAGHSVEDYCEVVRAMEKDLAVAAFELNISCPNVSAGGMAFGTEPGLVERLVQKIRLLTKKTLIVKLSPNVTDIVKIARAAEAGGADALSLINTLLGMAIDVRTRRPVLANLTGGLSGPAVKPVALRMVWQVTSAVNVPVIGLGGISCAQDATEFLLAGASAVAVGTANFNNPLICPQIIDGISAYLSDNSFSSLGQIIGLAKENKTEAGGECGCGKK